MESKFNEIQNLNNQISKLSNNEKELSIFISNLEKSLKEEKEKSYKMQNKLDKNVKELKEMNDYYKTLKTMLLFLFINVKIEENTSI
jgi:predicted  nucleic acid-binding Zn-ribbon protein